MNCVLVIDDHPIVLQGCLRVLQSAGVTHIVVARDLENGYSQYRAHKPDAIILDLTIGESKLGGISFIHRLRCRDRQTPILVFTMHDDPFIVRRTLGKGATGYVLKDGPFDELCRALSEVCNGRTYLSQCLATLPRVKKSDARNPLTRLNQRELETLRLLIEGKPYRAIAERMLVSCTTVAATAARVKAKLGVTSLPELMRAGLRYSPAVDRDGKGAQEGGEDQYR